VRLDATDFNSFLANECELLAGVARRLGRAGDERKWSALHRRLCDLINRRLWNEQSGLYVDCVGATGQPSDVWAASGFLPLLCGACDEKQARRLARHLEDPSSFGTPLPVPTISAGQPRHYSRDMWRGPVWVNLNWLIARGLDRYGLGDLAASIRARTCAEIERWYLAQGALYEFYDDRRELPPDQLPRKGRNVNDPDHPLNMVIHDYGWTATLYVDMRYASRAG
jgi:neutral trehalase